jgi:hypothetical protein
MRSGACRVEREMQLRWRCSRAGMEAAMETTRRSLLWVRQKGEGVGMWGVCGGCYIHGSVLFVAAVADGEAFEVGEV